MHNITVKDQLRRVRRQGFEPRTRGLREDRYAALSALPAQMACANAQRAPQCTTIPQGSFHESFHEILHRPASSVTKRNRTPGLVTRS
jgi:hypothetical protein